MSLESMAVELARRLEIDKKLPTALLSYDVPIPAYEFICMYVMIQIVHEMTPDKTGFYHCPVKLTRMLAGEHGKNNDYRRFNTAIDFLADTPIKWNIAREDKTVDAFRASFISTKRVNSKNGNPHFRINKDIEDLIKTTKVFSPMNLLMLAVFSHNRSAYPLYIHLFDAYSRGADSVRLTFSQLKVLFGVKESEYVDNFKDFNKKHIKPKCAFIVSNSDITFQYKNFREGRKVGGVDFFGLQKQEWQQVLFSKDDKNEIIEDIIALAREIDSTLKIEETSRSSDQYIRKLLSSEAIERDEELEEIFSLYKKYGVSRSKLRELSKNPEVGKRGLREILTQCETDIKKRAKTKNPIREPNKHVFWAVSSGWKDEGYGLKTQDEREQQDEKRNKLRSSREKTREGLRLVLEYYHKKQISVRRVEEVYSELVSKAEAEKDPQELLNDFISSLSHQWEINDVQRYGFETRVARSSLLLYLGQKYDIETPSIYFNEVSEKALQASQNHPASKDYTEKAMKMIDAKPGIEVQSVVDSVLPAI